jgi:hypothetical protein
MSASHWPSFSTFGSMPTPRNTWSRKAFHTSFGGSANDKTETDQEIECSTGQLVKRWNAQHVLK